METGSWVSSVEVEAGRTGVRTPPGIRDFSLYQNVQTGSGPHTTSYAMDTGVPFWEIKRPERPSSAEVRNWWSFTSTPPECRHGVDRDEFAFYSRDSS